MSKVDWSKAPEGTTHYVAGSTWLWGRRSGKDWYYWASPYQVWIEDNYRKTSSRYELVERPKEPVEWNGEGLPPTGERIEYYSPPVDRWMAAIVIGTFRGELVLGCEETGVTGQIGDDAKIRPLRTPEQIEAEERDKAIERIIDDYRHTVGSSTRCITRGQAARLYDAGYRKTEGSNE